MGYLRLLLALCVAVGHIPAGLYATPDTTIIFVGFFVAVKLFFIISGFYMAMIFHSGGLRLTAMALDWGPTRRSER